MIYYQCFKNRIGPDWTGRSDLSDRRSVTVPVRSSHLDRMGIEPGSDRSNRPVPREPASSIDFNFFLKKTTSKWRRFDASGIKMTPFWSPI